MPIMTFMTRFYNFSRHTHRIVSVSKHSNSYFLVILLAVMGIFTASCQKGLLKIGENLLPEGDLVTIKAIDTLHVYSYTEYNDSARTDNPSLSYLGTTYDPYFGTSTSGFVTQMRLTPKWDGLSFTVDSVKLFLHLLTTKGTQSDFVHSFSLYEIADQIYTDTAYYSNTQVNLTGFKIANIQLPTLRTDTINDIELSLPGSGLEFGNYLTRDTTKLFYNNNIPDFRSYFKGLYFQMDPNSDPLVVSLSLVYDKVSFYNYFVLFGHDDTGVSKMYEFNLDAKNANAHFNKFGHDFSTATLGDKMAHRNTTYKDTLSYLQSLNGVYTKISIPGLEKIKADPSFAKIAINRARIVVPVHYNNVNNDISSNVPPSLLLRYKTTNGTRYVVPDYAMSTTDVNHIFFDGQLDSINKVYNFNIPAFIQNYLNDATNVLKPELEIFQSAGTKNVVFEANKSKTPVKFEFTYTKF